MSETAETEVKPENTAAADEQAQEDTSIQKITLGVLGLCAFMLVWYLVGDRYTPYTDQARVTGHIIPVVPRVAGNVVAVNVDVNSRVAAGDVLFQIDPSDYQIAVEQAEARLQQVTQELGGGIEELTVAQASLSQSITQRDYVIAQSARVFELEKRGVLPVTDGDKARAEIEKSKADVDSARARLQQVQQRIGDQSDDNAYLQEALAAVEDANLDLARTELRAPSAGAVTSVNVAVGNFANTGQAIMTFVSAEDVWIEAYMRENSLGNVKAGDPVEIALDSAPGRIFHGQVVSTGYAVDWKNAANAGQVQSVSAESSWLRDAQRFPVIIRFEDRSEVRGLLRSGGQADVTIYTSGNWITNTLAWLWMRFITIMSLRLLTMTAAESRCALRFALGMALSIVLAYGISWPMAWLATILTAAFLGNRAPRLNFKATLVILLAIAIIFGVGLFFTLHFYHYPLVFALLVSLGLYLNFYMAARGGSKLIVLLCTMAILLIPLVGGAEPRLALMVAEGFLTSACVALLCTQVAHTLLPGGTVIPEKAKDVDPHAARSAWLSTAVILPVALICLAFSMTGAVLPLIQISALSQKPDFSVGAAGGKALIAANLAGGLVAIIFYQLLQITPTFPFLVAGLTALALLFGRFIFSGRPTAPLYASAFSTVLILIGGGTGQFGGDTDAGFYQRIVLILLSVCYVVGALSLLQMPQVRQRWMGIGRWLGGKLAAV